MPGGKIQLEAYGDQNDYFNENPDISFFKLLYKRHTNFSIETIKQYKKKFNFGDLLIIKIGRDGDLLTNLFLEINLNLKYIDTSNQLTYNEYFIHFTNNLIDYVEIIIGDTIIDKHYGKWMRIWNEITDDNDVSSNGLLNKKLNSIKETNINFFSNFFTKYQQMSGNGVHRLNSNTNNNKRDAFSNTYYTESNNDGIFIKGRMIVPFHFWFCDNIGLALPLIAIQYHEIICKIKLNNKNNSINISNESSTVNENGKINNLGMANNNGLDFDSDYINNSEITLWGDYIFLDTDERKKFASNSHEYLITQLQYQENIINYSSSSNIIVNNTIDLKFNFNIKELIWVYQKTDNVLYNCEFLSIHNNDASIDLLLNGKSRFINQNIMYFTNYNFKYHSGSNNNNSIQLYSFSLMPEEFQPYGFCNFSALKKVQLKIENKQLFNISNDDDNSVKINIFAINYNILRIMNGMCSLAYSN